MSSGDDHLQAWLSAFVGGDERLEWELTNVRTGVTRVHDGEEERTEPAPDYGAVAAVTDRRVLFLVGGAAADGGDDVTSIPDEEIAGVAAVEELLTSQLVVTTGAGATWRFTAREHGELADAVASLEERIAGAEHVDRRVERARDHREAAGAADDDGTAASRYDAAVEAYRTAVDLQTSPAVEADVDPDSLREEVLDTVESAFEAHLTRARRERSRGNWEFGAGDEAAAREHFSTALDAFERAHGLADETPVGDADAVARERDDLLDRLDDLDVQQAVVSADDA